MASTPFAPAWPSSRRISLAEMDTAVSARLGATRGLGNSQPACFNRQVAMYLAKHVGRWSTTVIGRFYSGRDHSTVCHGIQRIEALCESNPEVDRLLSDLKHELTSIDEDKTEAELQECASKMSLSCSDLETLAELIAERVCSQLRKRISM